MLKNLAAPAIAMVIAGALWYTQSRQPQVKLEGEGPTGTMFGNQAAGGRAAGGAPAASAPPATPGTPDQPNQPGATSAIAPRPPGPPAVPATIPAAPYDGRMRFYGVVYDLETAEAVSDAVITMVAPAMGGLKQMTVTDGAGHYRLDMPLGERVFVQAAASGYRTGQLPDEDPPYRSMPLPLRHRKAEEASVSDLAPFVPQHGPSENLVRLDLVMLQQKAGQPNQFVALPPEERRGGGQLFLPSEARSGNDARLAPVPNAPGSTNSRSRQIATPTLGQ